LHALRLSGLTLQQLLLLRGDALWRVLTGGRLEVEHNSQTAPWIPFALPPLHQPVIQTEAEEM
jgi:hypothetical protein